MSNIGSELARTKSGRDFIEKYYELMSNQYWRLNNFYQIVDKNSNAVRFIMNEHQKKLYADMWYFNIVPKARQLGFTTLIDLMALDYALFNDNVEVMIIAHKKDAVEDIFQSKIMFPYSHLPEEIRTIRPTVKQSKREIRFNNGSRIVVDLSGRSKTINFLHVSEFAKICREHPDRADEVVTGSIPAVHAGNMCFIESTSEGKGGYFADWCDDAHKRLLAESKLNKRQFKLHFFPWYLSDTNRVDSSTVTIYPWLNSYFETLKNKHGIELDLEQKAWYATEYERLGDKMKHENPSTFDECFFVSTEGTYYKKEFERIWKEKRITKVPHQMGYLVDTYWDLGYDDHNSIWFGQQVGKEMHWIDFYENSGENIDHYVNILRDKAQEFGWRYGKHVAPHDIEVHDYSATNNDKRWDVAARLGVHFEVATKLPIIDGVEATRQLLAVSWFDEEKCEEGYTALQKYSKEWDKQHGMWKPTPRKSIVNHASDAFRTAGVSWKNIHAPRRGVPVPSKRRKMSPQAWT